MLGQEELAFIKAINSIELSPVFLRELRNAVVASKKKALVATNDTATRALALGRSSGVHGEARTSCDSLQLNVSKRKAEKLSNSDRPTEPGSCHPAPGHVFCDGPKAQGTMGELTAQSSRQLGLMEGGLSYAMVVAGVASLQQPSRPHKSKAKGSIPTEPTTSSEAAAKRMSLGDMSGPLCDMPDGYTISTQVASNNAAPTAEQQHKTPIYISGVMDTCGFLTCLHALYHGGF